MKIQRVVVRRRDTNGHVHLFFPDVPVEKGRIHSYTETEGTVDRTLKYMADWTQAMPLAHPAVAVALADYEQKHNLVLVPFIDARAAKHKHEFTNVDVDTLKYAYDTQAAWRSGISPEALPLFDSHLRELARLIINVSNYVKE